MSIKIEDEYKIDNLLEIFHSEHDDNLLYVDLQMIQELLAVSPLLKGL